jgi:protein-S-isoprenylcysteine O-methyltransferase Ste14
MADKKNPEDRISRGNYTSNPLGSFVFIALRSLDPILQYSILGHGLGTATLHRIGLRTLPPGNPTNIGISAIDSLGLSPYRLILLSMAVGSAVKQNVWQAAISKENMEVGTAVMVAIFNTVVNSLNTYMFLVSSTSASLSNHSKFPQTPLLIGSAMYIVGLLTEYVAEAQRRRFKDDPKNKGKPYTGGLWAYARHINYGAYMIWRAGYALAAGGWVWGAVVGGFFFWDFKRRGVPVLNEYCEKRYGEDWEAFKRQTKWKLLPGIY